MAFKMWRMYICGQIVLNWNSWIIFYAKSHRVFNLPHISIGEWFLIFFHSPLYKAVQIVRSSNCRLFKGCFTSSEAMVEERNTRNSGKHCMKVENAKIQFFYRLIDVDHPTFVRRGRKSIKNLSPKLFPSLLPPLTISISWIFISQKFHFYELFYLTRRGTSSFGSFSGKIAMGAMIKANDSVFWVCSDSFYIDFMTFLKLN